LVRNFHEPAEVLTSGRVLPIRRIFHAKFNDAPNVTTAIQHPLDADAPAVPELPFSQLSGEFAASLANPLPNRIGQRRMFALYSFVDQGIKFAGVRRLASL
jgi:hypothetical protein